MSNVQFLRSVGKSLYYMFLRRNDLLYVNNNYVNNGFNNDCVNDSLLTVSHTFDERKPYERESIINKIKLKTTCITSLFVYSLKS